MVTNSLPGPPAPGAMLFQLQHEISFVFTSDRIVPRFLDSAHLIIVALISSCLFTIMPAAAVEIFDWIVNAFAGWRYLLSSSFRQRTHQRWKVEGTGKAFIEILFGVLGILLILLFVWWVIGLLRG